MDVNKVLKDIDNLYKEAKEEVSDAYLRAIKQAEDERDANSLLMICNEAIGHFRECGKHEESLMCAKQALLAAKELDITDTVEYGTTLVNIGTAARAAGLFDAALIYYGEALKVYEGKIDDNDFLYASLYNNLSLVYQQTEEYETSVSYLKKALEIVEKDESRRVETATTYSNLAVSEINMSKLDEAMEHLEKSFYLYEQDEVPDYHYSAALSAYAQALYLKGELDKSEEYYKKALEQIDKVMGKSENYEIVKTNLMHVQKMIEKRDVPRVVKEYDNGMSLCREYYEEIGKPMISEKFPEYEKDIAVGLVGEGSECFGYDDAYSSDHDFGPGFCMWLTDSVYDEIGEKLQEEYDKLPKTFLGATRVNTKKAGKRVGVFKISEFYEKYIGIPDVPKDNNTWLFLDDYRLCTASNGEVFRDDLGEFTRIRKGILNYYPEEVRRAKMARAAALISQSGQYNYDRMLRRDDTVTASIALSEFIKSTMSMMYLLNSKYAPFYKWMYKGLKDLPILNGIRGDIAKLSMCVPGDSEVSSLIEKIVSAIISEMKKQGISSTKSTYLDDHTGDIIHMNNNGVIYGEDSDKEVEKLVSEIVKLEWNAFDKVENEGGRASCQNDLYTFTIMRKSQYMTWPKELLESYIEDFKAANEDGRNLITEKYARMMESTAPKKWEEIKDNFPQIGDEKKAIIEEIVKIQVSWMEEFAKQYPKAAGNARSIHTSEDLEYNTSYETYLRGEISTYSDITLKLYGQFIISLLQDEKNLAYLTIENTAHLYGYESLDELEEKI